MHSDEENDEESDLASETESIELDELKDIAAGMNLEETGHIAPARGPADVVRWTQRSSICRERPRRQKVSSPVVYAPDFLPGASVQKRASHCALSSGCLGRSNKKIEFL